MNDSEAEDFGPVDTQASKRSKSLTEREESSALLPDDQLVEIFLRLPAKSIARYLCVSNRWASLLRLPYFTELFLIRSSSRPQLLFACDKGSHVFFDVRSEKFSFVTVSDIYTHLFQWSLLINYNGKLALGHDVTIRGSCKNILLRVLEDVEKQVWTQQIYVLPKVWKNRVGDTLARFVGVTRTNEIVLSSSSLQCLFYFNVERNKIIRVEIQGMEAFKHSLMFTFQDHVEDIKLMEVF